MPRLTSKQYLHDHDRLRDLWLREPRAFAEISPKEQWILYDYYMPHRELTDQELLQHRNEVTTKRPSLPHQAGRTLNRFWAATAKYGLVKVRRAKQPTEPRKPVKRSDRAYVVKAQVRPDVDVEKLARALMMLAEYQLEQRAKKREDDLDALPPHAT